MVLILLIKKYIDKKVAQILRAKLSNFIKSEKQFCISCCICYPMSLVVMKKLQLRANKSVWGIYNNS